MLPAINVLLLIPQKANSYLVSYKEPGYNYDPIFMIKK